MPGALVGVASCARCGGMQNSTDRLCRFCGTVLTPAAQGNVLGTYTPLLAGVAPVERGTRISGRADRRTSHWRLPQWLLPLSSHRERSAQR
jgi:hypothetical protein